MLARFKLYSYKRIDKLNRRYLFAINGDSPARLIGDGGEQYALLFGSYGS